MVMARVFLKNTTLRLLVLWQVFTPAAGLLSSTSTSPPPTTTVEWQEGLRESALPLPPTPLSQALSTLQRDGVVRIDGCSVDSLLCQALRKKMLDELASGDSSWEKSNKPLDKTYIPGTRLRFNEPIDISFGGDSRHDLLLPLSNSDWQSKFEPVLQSAFQQLLPLLVDVAEQILPRFDKEECQSHNLELVELAALIVRNGSSHQTFHGDYRRFAGGDLNSMETDTTPRMGKLPPRLVSFVALQDVPTKQHGSTGFVTGTHTAKAHDLVYEGQGIMINEGEEDCKVVADALKARESILDLSTQGVVTASEFKCGDMLIYDASVLHWGSPNSVPGNDRAILYFGVARPGAAAKLCEDAEALSEKGFEIAPPVRAKYFVGN